MATPSVSIIIPTRNRLSMLREALDSVHAQSFRDYEVIVVDDGSDRPIGPDVSEHAVKPKVIRHTKSLGPAAARNRGLRESAADTVAFLDSDDLWHPTKLERFKRELDADPDLRILYGPMEPIDEEGRAVPGRTKPCHGGRITEKLFRSSFVHVPTVVCDKSVLLDRGGFDETLPVCEDYDLWLRVSVDFEFGLVEEPLAQRRLHANRLSKACMSRNLAVKAYVLRRFYESHAANGHLGERVAIQRLARACFVAGRAAFREGRFRQAEELCRASRAFGAPYIRTLPLGWASGALGCFFDKSDSPVDAPATSRKAVPT